MKEKKTEERESEKERKKERKRERRAKKEWKSKRRMRICERKRGGQIAISIIR